MIMRLWILVMAVCLVGCVGIATDPKQIAKRRAERITSYNTFTLEQKIQVDRGQIKVGMSEDGVYIAWGVPSRRVKRGDTSGEETIWLYTSSTTDQYIHWTYIEVIGQGGRTYIDRITTTDYAFRDYICAKLIFRDGLVISWEMLPQPSGDTIFIN